MAGSYAFFACVHGAGSPSVTSVRRAISLGFLTGVVLAAATAEALVWPDVPDRVERGLASPDPATRRVAARDLASLGATRAAPLVTKAMGDADVEVRLAAAQSAIRLRLAATTEAVVPWLGEREPKLRAEACDVAHAMPNPRVVQPLARALGDSDPNVRGACADALGASRSAEAVAPLAGKLDDPTPNVRSQVARALARLGDPRAVVPLVGKVQDSVPEVRQAVVRALGDLGDGRATQALLLALRDNVPEVKIEALSALGRLRAPDAVDAIAPLALERNPAVRQGALIALGRIGTPRAVRALAKALGTQEDATAGLERTPVRDALVSAGPAAVTELTPLLDRPISASVATSIAWVLGELRATSSAGAIVAALRKGTLPPAAALRGLAGAGTPEQVPVVLEFVADPGPQVREEARGAAMALLDPTHPDGRAVEPLAATLKSARTAPQERAALAMLLGRTGAPRAAAELIGLANAKDSPLRLAAIDALGALGAAAAAAATGATDPDRSGQSPVQSAADDALVPLLSDTDAPVRLHAAIAVGAAGGVKARKLLLAKLGGREELDRFALFTALGGVLERYPDDAATKRAWRELEIAAGPERDALIEAGGRARVPSALKALGDVAKSSDPDDRRAVAEVLAAQTGAPAVALLRTLLDDHDPSIRAEAAFALGSAGDAAQLPVLTTLLRGGDVEVATNASAALARIARKLPSKVPTPVAETACATLGDGRPAVRANALATLAILQRRCGDGRAERKLLVDDPSELVRANAARVLLASDRSADDRIVLDRCVSSDRSAEVAQRCRPLPAAPSRGAPSAVTVFVIGEGATPAARPHASYLLQYVDGVLRAGTADRRGALFDPLAPAGDVALRHF